MKADSKLHFALYVFLLQSQERRAAGGIRSKANRDGQSASASLTGEQFAVDNTQVGVKSQGIICE